MGIFQLFPRAAAVRAVPHRQRGEQVVAETFFERFVRDGHIEPVLGGIQPVEVEGTQEIRRQQRAAETAMLFFGINLSFLSFGVQVRIVDFPFFVHRYGGSNATIGTCRRSVKQCL